MNKIIITALAAVLIQTTGVKGSSSAIADALAPRPAPHAVQDDGGEAVLEREGLIAQVLERNPGIEAARQAWRAALEQIPQATSLEDPMLAVSIAPLSIGGDRFGSVVRGSQTIPFPGKLRLRGEMARAEVAAMAADVEMVRLELAAMASMVFDQYFVVHRALAINAHHAALMSDLKKSAEVQYMVGNAAQQDPLQAEVELARLARQKIELEAERDVTRARINALLHRTPGAALAPPPAQLPVPGPLTLTSEELQVLAVEQRPALGAARARILAGEASVEMAGLVRYPDFELMVENNRMFMETEHQYMVGVGINLPVWRESKRAAIREAEARLEQRRQEALRVEDEVRLEVDRFWSEVRRLEEILQVYRDHLIPAASDQVEAARSGFETGRSPFVAVIEAENNLREASLDYTMAIADLYMRLAQLQRATGTMVTFVPKGGQR